MKERNESSRPITLLYWFRLDCDPVEVTAEPFMSLPNQLLDLWIFPSRRLSPIPRPGWVSAATWTWRENRGDSYERASENTQVEHGRRIAVTFHRVLIPRLNSSPLSEFPRGNLRTGTRRGRTVITEQALRTLTVRWRTSLLGKFLESTFLCLRASERA